MAKHAELSASGSNLWLNCAGSLAMSEGVQDSAGESARWGTATHFLAAACLENDCDPIEFRGKDVTLYYHADSDSEGECFHDEIDPASVDVLYNYTVDDRMMEMAQVYIDIVRGLADSVNGSILVEQTVDYSAAVGVPEQFGTADAIILGETELIVVDLKTGQSPVAAQGNTQMRLYALGALEEFGMVSDFEHVRMVIVQPPKSHKPDEALESLETLQSFASRARRKAHKAKALKDIGREAMLKAIADGEEPEDILNPGEHCYKSYCKGRAFCPKLRAEVTGAVFEAQPTSPEEFEDLNAEDPRVIVTDRAQDPEWLSAAMKKVNLVEEWCKAVREQAFAKLDAGEDIPDLKLVAGKRGARQWADPEKAEETMKSMRLKQGEMYKQSLQTPTAIEKLLKDSPRRWNRIESLIVQPEGKPVVAFADDKRPALPRGEEQFEDLTDAEHGGYAADPADAGGDDINDLI